MNSLQKSTKETALAQIANPYQLAVAKELSHKMASTQAQELLASDILFKIGNLALIQAEIIKNNPEALAYTDYVIRAFTHYNTEKLK